MKEFLCSTRGDRVERSLIAPRLQTPQVGAGVAAIVVAAVLLWVSIGHEPMVKLGIVDASIGGEPTAGAIWWKARSPFPPPGKRH